MLYLAPFVALSDVLLLRNLCDCVQAVVFYTSDTFFVMLMGLAWLVAVLLTRKRYQSVRLVLARQCVAYATFPLFIGLSGLCFFLETDYPWFLFITK